MAVQTGSVTMAQAAAHSNEPLVQTISMSLVDMGSVLARDIPFIDKPTIFVNGVRFEGGLPAITWAALNQEGVTVSTAPSAFQEQVYILRNQVDIDEFLARDMTAIRDVRATQVEVLLKSIAFDVNEKFITNRHDTGDANAFVGLRQRIAAGSTYGVRAENLINGGGIDLSLTNLATTAGAPTAGNFFELLDQLLFSVDAPDGSPQVTIYCNEDFKRRLNHAVRTMGTQGGFNQARDMYDRVVDTYKSCIIRDIGRKRDQVSRIITNTELANGLADTGNVCTSIYAVNYSEGHFGGWQFNPLAAGVQNLGRLNTGVQFRTYVSWAGGLINYSTRSIARLYGIKMS
jgi:hypothetical protein